MKRSTIFVIIWISLWCSLFIYAVNNTDKLTTPKWFETINEGTISE